jgi:hypothetical protein
VCGTDSTLNSGMVEFHIVISGMVKVGVRMCGTDSI